MRLNSIQLLPTFLFLSRQTKKRECEYERKREKTKAMKREQQASKKIYVEIYIHKAKIHICVALFEWQTHKHTISIHTYISAYILIWNLLIKWEKNMMMMMMMLMHTRITTTTPTTSKNSYGRTYWGIERYRVACFACSCSRKHTHTYTHNTHIRTDIQK